MSKKLVPSGTFKTKCGWTTEGSWRSNFSLLKLIIINMKVINEAKRTFPDLPKCLQSSSEEQHIAWHWYGRATSISFLNAGSGSYLDRFPSTRRTSNMVWNAHGKSPSVSLKGIIIPKRDNVMIPRIGFNCLRILLVMSCFLTTAP